MNLCTKRQNYYRQLDSITVGGNSTSAVMRFLFALSILLFILQISNNKSFAAPYPPEVRNVGMFELRFYSGSLADPNYVPNGDNDHVSNLPFSTEMINDAVKYVGYWEQLIDPSRVNSNYKIVINFVYNNSGNAEGDAPNIINIINNGAKPNPTKTDGIMIIGNFNPNNTNYKTAYRETIMREFGHLLGFNKSPNEHSVMSGRNSVNMPFVPEKELQVLVDLGYSVNLRKAFGHSYDGDSYKDRIVDGVGYDSEFMFGVGAHVFMDDLKLLQSANITSRGEEGVGIRIDGSRNMINIDKYTTINASGEYGIGLLVALGNDNTIINRGNITANGENGIGVRFDARGGNSTQNSSFSGPVNINRFDISGKISGDQYAIFISDTATVNNINIMNGAEIYGNIKSASTDTLTSINFGYKADSDGNVTNEVDPNFMFVLNDALQGANQFNITTVAGTTTIGEYGTLNANKMTIKTDSHFNIASNYNATNQNQDKIYVTELNIQNGAILGVNTVYYNDENPQFLRAGSVKIESDAILDITSFKKGTYTVLSAGALEGEFNNSNILVAGKAPSSSRHKITMTQEGNSIKLTLDANNATLRWKGGNVWNNGAEWYNNGRGGDDVFIDGDDVIFGNTINPTFGAINVPVRVEAKSATFESNAYRFTGAEIFVTENLDIINRVTEVQFGQNVQTQYLKVDEATLGIDVGNVIKVKADAEFNQATLEIGTNEDVTKAGKISVAGKAVIRGGVVNVYGAQRRGAQYLFLEAGEIEVDSVLGGFVLGATTGGRRGIVSYDDKKYWLTIDGLLIDHSQNALTSNQVNLGGYLNVLSPRVNDFNEMNSVLMTFENLSENSPLRYQKALDETAGNIYASAGAASLQNTTIANRTIATYLRRPPLSEVIPCYICRGICQHLVNKPTSWATVVGMGGTTQSDSNSHGYSQSSGGSVFGVDIMRRVGFHFGIYGSAMENLLTSKGIREHSRSHEFMGGFYFRADNSIGYFLFNNGYGFNQYKTSRTMSEFGNRKARSSHDSFNSTFYGELGTYYLDPIFRWHGYIGFQYAGVYQEAVNERDAGSLNIIGDPVSTTSMRSFLGVRTERFERTLGNGMISGDFNFAWMHECMGRIQTEFTGRFEGSPDSSLKYTVLGARTGRDWAIFGASIGYEFGRVRVFGGYDAYLNGDQSLHTGTLGTVYVW